jgi:hypothetical protein
MLRGKIEKRAKGKSAKKKGEENATRRSRLLVCVSVVFVFCSQITISLIAFNDYDLKDGGFHFVMDSFLLHEFLYRFDVCFANDLPVVLECLSFVYWIRGSICVFRKNIKKMKNE